MHICVNGIVYENKSLIHVAYANEEVVEGPVHVPIVNDDTCYDGRGEEETMRLSTVGCRHRNIRRSIVQEFKSCADLSA
jgi:hypothetical protein